MSELRRQRDTIAVVVMPIVIVLLTAAFGTGVGWILQNRAFRRNEVFRVRLQRLMWLHSQAVESLRDVDLARRQIRSNEELVADEIRRHPGDRAGVVQFYASQNLMRASLNTLKETRIRLDALSTDSQSLTSGASIAAITSQYAAESDQFISCVETNKDFSKSCSAEAVNLMPKMQAVIAAYGKMIDDFAAHYD